MTYIKTYESYIMQDVADKNGIILDLYDNGEYFELDRIEIPKKLRGRGIGFKIMQKIIDRADAEGKDIVLTPSIIYGATSTQRLENFYKQFGFILNKNKNRNFKYKHKMIRYAKK